MVGEDGVEAVLLPILRELRDHTGPALSVGSVVSSVPGAGVGGLSLEGLGFLREHSVELDIPLYAGQEPSETIQVRVPTLSAFLVHKGVIFFRRNDRARKAKDLLYIVEIMAEGDPLVATIEEGIRRLCHESPTAGSVARKARNNIALVLSQAPGALLHLVSEALAARRGWGLDAAEARARGFLDDFVHLIPEDFGKGKH